MLILLLHERSFTDWSVWSYLLWEVLMKRRNVQREILRDLGRTRGLQGKTWMQQDTLYCIE